MTNALIDTQLRHNEWAIRRLIEASRHLTPDQFDHAHDIGPPPGSLQGTLAHLIAGMFFFADNFNAREYLERPNFSTKATTPDGLTALLEEADGELRAAVTDFLAEHDVLDPLTWLVGDLTVTAATALAQVFNQGSHHRAQCIYMFKRLGMPWPELWPLEWAAETQA
jgi:uncharacterized damage-inducible protein DinB